MELILQFPIYHLEMTMLSLHAESNSFRQPQIKIISTYSINSRMPDTFVKQIVKLFHLSEMNSRVLQINY